MYPENVSFNFVNEITAQENYYYDGHDLLKQMYDISSVHVLIESAVELSAMIDYYKYFLDQSIRKRLNSILKTEALVRSTRNYVFVLSKIITYHIKVSQFHAFYVIDEIAVSRYPKNAAFNFENVIAA